MFKNRLEAAQKLSQAVKTKLVDRKKLDIVVALPRGGVPMGQVLAQEIGVPLDIVVPRKIGAPGHEEYAIGALTEDGSQIFNETEKKNYSQEAIEKKIKEEKKEAQRRLKLYRGQRESLDLSGKNVLLVDDGIATGLTMEAAIKSCKNKGAQEIIVAIPVSARDSLEKVRKMVDEVVCLETPALFMAVGQWYSEFPQTLDKEVIEILRRGRE
ncbi:phosphoribosyltransferase [Patescibacteria group bacterium]|nr:phosphoribosyltransferase [Patescibacteria group bacterium]